MNFDKYKNNLAYPDRVNYTIIGYVDRLSDDVVYLSNTQTPLESYVKFKEELNKEAYEAYRKAYYAHEAELHERFLKDLLDEYGMEDNKLSRELLAIAWGDWHSSGLSEVANCFSNISHLYSFAKETFLKEK